MAQDRVQTGEDDALGAAIRRLETALDALEHRLVADGQREGDLFDTDRPALAAELSAARAREKALEQVAAEASAALGRAAAEVRAALSAEQEV